LKSIFFLSIITTLALGTGCSSIPDYDQSLPDGVFKTAEALQKEERFEEALKKYAEVKNKFPYNSLATEAELRIADIHYERESFAEAEASYSLFKELHPKHPRSDYVTYRLAMSYFSQLPSTIDRDLSLAHDSIKYFEEVIKYYPQSEYVKDSQEKLKNSREQLSEKEMYVARFYEKRDYHLSALKRYRYVLSKFPDTDQIRPALLGAGRMSKALEQNEEAKKYFQELISKFPESEEAGEARSEAQ